MGFFSLIALSILAFGTSYSASASEFALELATGTEEPTTPPEGDGALSFCHDDKWSTACLTGLMIYRCEQYTFPLTAYGCMLGATAFVDSLEMKRIDVELDDESYNLPVIYTKRLERMIRDPAIHSWLAGLRTMLVASAKTKKPFDLWKWTHAISMSRHEQALERLAVLLQDTSAIAIQVKYLQQISALRRFNSATLKAITDLDEITYQLNHEILSEGDWQSRLRLYPPIRSIEKDTTPLIYHFYPMAFSARLLQLGGFGDRLSSFLPFLFNTEYLNQTLDPEAWPLRHPKPFTAKLDDEWIQWKMRDMYGGYAGALWGIRKTALVPGLSKFQSGYAKKPFSTMQHLFWSMPNP